MLILQGPQGIRKSTFFKVAGGEWTVTIANDLEFGSAGCIETMRRGWVVEVDELSALKRAKEHSHITAFVSKSEDFYNAKFIRETQMVKRSSIFGGTTNDEYFLVDTTGSRRYWVVPVRKQIDTDLFAEFREQLFAEAVSEYKAGEQWHLEPELEKLRDEKNAEYRSRHPWEEIIQEGLQNHKGTVSVGYILGEILQKPAGLCTPKDSSSVANILVAMGWRQVRKTDDTGKRPRVYEKPAPWETDE
jgi:predicted P-loop ATPase